MCSRKAEITRGRRFVDGRGFQCLSRRVLARACPRTVRDWDIIGLEQITHCVPRHWTEMPRVIPGSRVWCGPCHACVQCVTYPGHRQLPAHVATPARWRFRACGQTSSSCLLFAHASLEYG
eukprot:2490608-Amphidinium_carterae.1